MTDDFTPLPSYIKDNQVLFNAKGTYVVNEGSTRTSPSNPFVIETGEWWFAQNETLIIITPAGSTTSRDGTIETLSASTFSYTFVGMNSSGTYTVKERYGH